MKKIITLSAVAVIATALVGCSTTANTNLNTNVRNANVMANSNVAVVFNNNSNTAMNSNMSSATNSNISRTDYDKDRAKYEANKGASTIGQGANDSWIWFKTKAALAAASGLSDSTINVDVANDVVTLKGSVKTAAQKTQAETVAKGIENVKSVTNQLKVDANDSMTNQMTSDGAKTANANANKR